MTQIFVEVWAQFTLTKDGKWTMRAWQDRPDWLPDGKFYLVRVPVPSELIGGEITAEVAGDADGARREFEKAVAMQPNDAEAHMELAKIR
jgi:hypothetical protein